MRKFAFLVVLCFLSACAASAAFLFDFTSSEVPAVEQYMINGQPSIKLEHATDGGSGVLKVNYSMGTEVNDHIVFAIPIQGDLSSADAITLRLKGDGLGTHIYIYLRDEQGNMAPYGPHSGKTDFTTDSTDWKTLKVDLVNDNPVGSRTDLFKVHDIGFMVNDNGKKEAYSGSFLIDDITLISAKPRVSVYPSRFSPNGDGIKDSVKISVNRSDVSSVAIKDSKGKTVCDLASKTPGSHSGFEIVWDAKNSSGTLIPAGKYKAETSVDGKIIYADIILDNSRVFKTATPVGGFFPVGAWYEGAPGRDYSGSPLDLKDAARHYDKTFADLAAHNINTLAIPNAPEAHWGLILRTAEKHGLKIILEIKELADLVTRSAEVSEHQAYQAAKRITDKLRNYPALLRYQIKDEPFPSMTGNWVMVKRALEDLDPVHPAFSCFCTHDSLSCIAKETVLNEAVFDCYPVAFGSHPGYIGGFVGAVDEVTRRAKSRPVWMVLQVHGAKTLQWFGLRTPLPAELRRMTYLSLARNSKGIFYFIYQSEQGWDGMVDKDLKPLPIFDEVGKLSGELKKLAPALLNMAPASEFVKADAGATSACFIDNNRKRYAMVVNNDVMASKEVTLQLTGSYSSLEDLRTGRKYAVNSGKAAITVAPGDGIVLRVE